MIEDLFDGFATFKRPVYVTDGSKGTRIADYEDVAVDVPMQATPVTPFTESYDTEVAGMSRHWEVMILDPTWEANQNLKITLKGAGYNNNELNTNAFERYNNAGSTIPTYVVFNAVEYKGTGDNSGNP